MNHDMVIKYGPREPRRTPKLPIPKKEEPTIKDLQEEIERLKKRVKNLIRPTLTKIAYPTICQ